MVRSSWKRWTIHVSSTENVETKRQFFTSFWMTWIRSIRCINSVLIGTKNSSTNQSKKWSSRLSEETKSKPLPSGIRRESTKKLAKHCLRNINCYCPCKCVSSYRCQRDWSTKMNGTSSLLVAKFWTDQLSQQSPSLIGSLKMLGTTLPSLKRTFLNISRTLQTVSTRTISTGRDGIIQSSQIHLKKRLYQVSGILNVRTDSRRWSY